MIKSLFLTTFILVLSALSYGEEMTATQPETEVAAATTTAVATIADNTALVAYAAEAATPTDQVAAVKTAETVKLPEDQIPLSIAAEKKMTEAGTPSAKAMSSAAIVLILLGASYYFVRRYKTSNVINKSNMQIKILTQHYLGPKKSLAIVHVAGESMLIGITDSGISMIKSLSLIDDEVPTEMPKTFSESMTNAAGATSASKNSADELDEEFSFSGVTDSVSKKIKSMRSLS